jgi:hypothetical protein
MQNPKATAVSESGTTKHQKMKSSANEFGVDMSWGEEKENGPG